MPGSDAISAVNVTNADGEPITSVKVGDEVRVAVAVSGDVLFRDTGIPVQLQPQDGIGSYQGQDIYCCPGRTIYQDRQL